MRCRVEPAAGGITYFTVPQRLVIQSTGETVGEPVRRAVTHLQRSRGLLGSGPDEPGVLLLEKARQVHTFGMRYAIDVIFCDAEWKVVHVVRDMRPARVTRWVRAARVAIELPSHARRVEVSRGDLLRLEPC